MAGSFQQHALHRKLIYVAAIVVLFTASLLFRNYALEPQAAALALREQNVGTVDLSGYALRLSLTGMRGVASCILWHNAMDMQKKNEWDELEILVNSITKLQPHFITPWLFQSWNLSYNVSVQCDRQADKYFYIARGIQLLAEGERQNQFQPELRFAMGTYYHQKIAMHDHKVELQNLFEMSGIDPVYRDPQWLSETGPDGQPRKDHLGRPRFEGFCKDNPRLVRRLREKLGCANVKQVYDYLKENEKIPTLFADRLEGEGDDLHHRKRLNRDRPFPEMPPARDPATNQRVYDPTAPASTEEMGGDFDAIAAGRVWYGYAQEALPPPADKLPGASVAITDPIHQRLPQHMTTVIFRDYPALAQSIYSERVQDEGWFDESGWKITGWFKGDRFPSGEPAVVGQGPSGGWGVVNWGKAKDLWEDFGKRNNLIWPPSELEALRDKASKFVKKYNQVLGSPPAALLGADRDDPEMQESQFAAQIFAGLLRARQLTNFTHQYGRTLAESTREAVSARKELFEAEQLRLAGRAQALKKYESALRAWAQVLDDNPDFRSLPVCEDSFELEWNYLQLWQATPEATLMRQAQFAEAVLGAAAVPGPDLGCLELARFARPQAVVMPELVGPLDGLDSDGDWLVEPGAVDAVLRRKRLVTTPVGPPAGMQMPGRPGSGGPPPQLPKPPRPNVTPVNPG